VDKLLVKTLQLVRLVFSALVTTVLALLALLKPVSAVRALQAALRFVMVALAPLLTLVCLVVNVVVQIITIEKVIKALFYQHSHLRSVNVFSSRNTIMPASKEIPAILLNPTQQDLSILFPSLSFMHF
jgi:hypothetical protein